MELRFSRQQEELKEQMAAHVYSLQEQLAAAGADKAALREALISEQAAGGARLAECQRLAEKEARLMSQVEHLTSEMTKARHESKRALKVRVDGVGRMRQV